MMGATSDWETQSGVLAQKSSWLWNLFAGEYRE
jgi:hypothetical protein